MTISKQQMLDSLYSNTCPACGDHKGEQKSLCYQCFSRLPGKVKNDLYQRFGHGYEPAFEQAMGCLGAKRFHEAAME